MKRHVERKTSPVSKPRVRSSHAASSNEVSMDRWLKFTIVCLFSTLFVYVVVSSGVSSSPSPASSRLRASSTLSNLANEHGMSMGGISGALQEHESLSKSTADAAVGYLKSKLEAQEDEDGERDTVGSVEEERNALEIEDVAGEQDKQEESELEEEERLRNMPEASEKVNAKVTARINPNNPEKGQNCPGGKKKCRGDANMLWSTVLMKPSKQDIGNIWAQDGSKALPLDEGTILDCSDVDDKMPALFIADPFLYVKKEDKSVYLFTEIVNNEAQKGEIGLHVSHDGGAKWSYHGVVVSEPWHLSFPFVVEWKDKLYMTTCATAGHEVPGRLWLYEPLSPGMLDTAWHRDAKIEIKFREDQKPKRHIVDPILFWREEQKTWYLFYLDDGIGKERLFFADDLLGEFTEHPQSQKYSNMRQSGAVNVDDSGRMWVFDHGSGGLTSKQITTLTRKEYAYKDGKSLHIGSIVRNGGTTSHWAPKGIHTMNSVKSPSGDGSWLVVTDGWWDDGSLSIHKCLESGKSNEECHKLPHRR